MALEKTHLKVLKENHFEECGELSAAITRDEWDDCRVLYAITDPANSRIVYIGDTEVGRNLRSRLRAHLNDRSKIGAVEPTSRLWVHFMVTEFKVLCDFEDLTGKLPELNKRKSQK